MYVFVYMFVSMCIRSLFESIQIVLSIYLYVNVNAYVYVNVCIYIVADDTVGK